MYSLRGVAEFGGGRTQNRKTNKEYDFRLSEKQRALLRRKPAHETGFRTDRLDRLDDDGTGYSRTRRQGHLEIHNEYIDIQVLIRGEEESFGWSERRELKKPLGEFSVENDIQLFDDVPQTYYTMRPGQFTVLFPEDGHAPMVGEGTVRKIIVKVRR